MADIVEGIHHGKAFVDMTSVELPSRPPKYALIFLIVKMKTEAQRI